MNTKLVQNTLDILTNYINQHGDKLDKEELLSFTTLRDDYRKLLQKEIQTTMCQGVAVYTTVAFYDDKPFCGTTAQVYCTFPHQDWEGRDEYPDQGINVSLPETKLSPEQAEGLRDALDRMIELYKAPPETFVPEKFKNK